MAYLSVLLTDFTEPFATYVIIASLQHSTGCAASLSFTNVFFLCGALLVFSGTCLAPKISVTNGAGDSDVGEGARWPSHTVATRLVADVCDITCTRLVTRFTHKLFRHRARHIHDHVIVPFDIIIGRINSLRVVDLPFEQYVFTGQAFIDSYLSPENVLEI